MSRASRLLLLLLLAACVTTAAQAEPADRAERWEAYFQIRQTQGENVDLDGPASIEVNDDTSWGFGFGYNFNNKMSLGGAFTWGSANFKVNTLDENGDTLKLGGTLDTASTLLNGTYYFMDSKLTPYVSGLLGWTYIDSNIPAGPPVNVCWWDPWYGYVCSLTQPTHSETSFSYGGSLGVRWDGPRGFFLRGGVSELWMDVNAADGTPSFTTWNLDIGSTF